MEREGAGPSLHHMVMQALARGAQAQEHSRALIATTQSIRAHLDATRADVRRTYESRVKGDVRIRTSR
jgi:hypothetical protein